MADQAEQDIEFVPSDELTEPDRGDAEDAAIRPSEPEEPRGPMTVEAEDFEADQLDQDVADEIEVEADEKAQAEAEAEAVEEVAEEVVEEEREEDLEEILQRHYGILSAEPEEALARAANGAAEFLCGSCFLRKPISQLADPERSICADCVTNGG